NKLPPAPSPHAASPAPVASPPAPESPEVSDSSSINIGGPPAAAGVDRAGDSNVATHSIDPDRSLEVMYHTAIAVGRTEDLDEVLQRVLRLVFDWVEADRGCIMLRDAASGQLQAAARCDRDETPHAEHHGAPVQVPDESTGQPISISRTILDYVIEKREGVRTSNARDDARFDAAASIVRSGVREAICVPLQGRYDIVGALYVDTFQSPHTWIARGGQRRFHDDHLRLMTAIGHQAALAIEDTTYYSALLQSERLAAMGQTIAMISHHVKNILQGIRGGGYLIDAGLKREDTDAVRRGWAIVDRNQERISNLVMDMLTFSKEREPEMQHADLNATVSDAAELMRNRAHEKQVDVEVDLDVGIVEAHFDPEAIHRAVINLITNAIDAASDHARDLMDQRSEQQSELDGSSGTAPASRVSIATSRRGRRFVISVADTGPGVAPEIRAKIFSPFESGKGMRGTGLGLPVCDKIAREHGGEIEIDDRPGGGAIFRIILPPAPKKTDETQI
ncbi:MAG: GAF domain-containing sensor histidine kinase, partial [Planctomycetota bacterium]